MGLSVAGTYSHNKDQTNLGPCVKTASPSVISVVTPRRLNNRRTVRVSNLRNLIHIPCEKIVTRPSEQTNLKLAVLNVRSLCNKSFSINNFIHSRNLDFIF